NSTAFLIKIKLRHSLGRPSRSDFVQSVFNEEVMIMSRNIKGGFLTLSGVVGIVGMIIAAMQNPATAWVTPPGRMIVSILENGLSIPTVLFLALFIYGLYILLTEKND
ncbi:hypothetical protein AAAT60_19415, partial [Blautia wexlerae]